MNDALVFLREFVRDPNRKGGRGDVISLNLDRTNDPRRAARPHLTAERLAARVDRAAGEARGERVIDDHSPSAHPCVPDADRVAQRVSTLQEAPIEVGDLLTGPCAPDINARLED